MDTYIYIYVYLSIYISIYIYVYLYIYIYICIYVYIYVYIYVSIHTTYDIVGCLSIHMNVHIYDEWVLWNDEIVMSGYHHGMVKTS